MFSKKSLSPVPAVAPEAPSGALAAARAFLTRPPVAAGGAGALLLLSALGLIAVAGDPQAGAPVVKLSLSKIGAPPPGWREALAPEHGGAPLISEGLLQLSATPIAPPEAGHAVITLPEGAPPMAGQALAPAPLAGLQAPSPAGPLPIIAADGRTPAQAYARPFISDGRPKIALVIGGLGLNAKATREAIEQLPPQVTLSFVPYSEGLQGWIDLARSHGHEVLLEAPMEPSDYPDNDPGPYTLLADAPAPETVRKMEWLMSRATGYFGLTNYLGSRFVTSDAAMGAFAQTLRQRGLAFVDDGSAQGRASGPPRASANRIIDDELSAEAIDQQLLSLESGALQRGQALGSGFAYPVTLAQVSRWAGEIERRGFQLAPASALTKGR